MEWDQPVKEVSPSTANQPAAEQADAHAAPSASASSQAGAQAGLPMWSEDIRAYYQAAAQEPIPQDFVDLMAQIAKQIQK